MESNPGREETLFRQFCLEMLRGHLDDSPIQYCLVSLLEAGIITTQGEKEIWNLLAEITQRCDGNPLQCPVPTWGGMNVSFIPLFDTKKTKNFFFFFFRTVNDRGQRKPLPVPLSNGPRLSNGYFPSRKDWDFA